MSYFYWMKHLLVYLLLLSFYIGGEGNLKAQSFTTIYPKNNSMLSDSSVTFEWNYTKGYSKYKLEVSNSPSFSSYAFSGSQLLINQQLVQFSNFGQYYWRVKAFSVSDSIVSNISAIELFSPIQIQGIQAWFVPEKGITTSNDKITQWADISGKNRIALQSDTSKAPTLIPNSLNGYASIQYDGVNDALIFQDSITVNSALVLSAWDGANAAFPSYNTLLSCTSPTGGAQLFVTAIGTSNFYYGGFFGSSYYINAINSTDYSPLQQYKVTSAFKSVSYQYSGSQILRIGNDNYYDPWKGRIPEIILYNNSGMDVAALTKLNLYLFNKYSPPVNLGADVIVPYGFCSKTITASNANFTSYLWNTGATTGSIAVNKTGTYSVTVSDIFGRTSTDDIFVAFPDGSLNTADTTICFGQTITVKSLLFPQAGYTYLWSDNSGLDSIKITGNSNLYATITDSLGCSAFSDTIVISIDSFPKKISLGNDKSMCSGNKVSLVTYTGNPNTFDYLWSDSSTDSTLIVQTTGNYWLSVTNSNGCTGKDTIHVLILGTAPLVSFSADTVCLGKATRFFNNSSPSYDSLFWDFGDAAKDTVFSPVHTYNNSGSYLASLKEYSGVCSNTVTKTVFVKPNPIANYSFTNSCAGFPVLFNDSSLHNGSGTITKHIWDFGGLGSSFASDTSFIFPVNGSRLVSLAVISSNGCSDTLVKTVNTVSTAIQPIVATVLPVDGSIVSGSPIHFSWQSMHSIENVIEISTDNFNSILLRDTTALDQIDLSPALTNNQLVSWRIRSYNYCFEEVISSPSDFTYFNPLQIAGINLWLDAGNGILVDGSNKVREWKNRVDTLDLTVQPNAAFKPLYITNDSLINNKPSVSFDGSDDILLNATGHKIGAAFILSRWSGAENTFPDYNGLMAANNTSTPFPYIFIGDKNTSNIYNSAPWSGNVSVNNLPSGNYGPLNRYKILYGESASPQLMNGYIIGSAANAWGFWKGGIAEVLMFDQAPSDSIKDLIINYFRYKYSPPINLGPDLNVPYGFCNKTIVGSKPWFTNYLWSTGDTTANISVNRSGTFWVSTKDIFGFTSKDTIQVSFPAVPSLTGSTVLCQGTTKKWDTGYPKNDFDFQWQDNSTDSVLTISGAGNYWVKVTDTLGCYNYSDTITITVDNYASQISLGNDTSLCSGNSIYLKAGAAQTAGYLWKGGSTNDSLTVTTAGQYWVTVNNANGCVKTDTMNVAIAGSAPTANFSSANVCQGITTNFTDLSAPPGGSTITNWSWDFNDPASGVNNTSILQNPVHMYADTGTYIVKLKVTTNAGCSQDVNKIVRVYPNPVANFSSANLCSNSAVQFTGAATMYGYPVNQWSWNFGDPASGTANASALQNPTHVYATSTSFTVQLTVDNVFGCAGSVTKNIVIKPLPVADFNYSTACKGSFVQFTDNSILPPATTVQSTTWNFGDNGTASTLNPKHTYPSTVNYTVSHIITASNGCKDTAIKTVSVYPAPYAYFYSDNACINAPVGFKDLSVVIGGNITGWLWNFGNGDTAMTRNPEYTFTTFGNKNVKLVVATDKGCKDSVSNTVVVHAPPVAGFTITPPYGTVPLTVNLTNTSTGASTYLWDFGDTTQSILMSPSHQYLSVGSYRILLSAKNNFGCEDTTSKILNVLEPYLDVAIVDVIPDVQNGFLDLVIKVANVGSVDVTNMDFYINVKNGPVLKEKWTGVFPMSSIMSYNLSSSAYVEDARDYLCVTVDKPNGLDDAVAANNKLCKAIDDYQFKVLDLYPNPSVDELTIPLIVPADDKILKITIYNTRGAIVKNAYEGYIGKGLQMLAINTLELSSGIYACKIEYKDYTIIKTFIKR